MLGFIYSGGEFAATSRPFDLIFDDMGQSVVLNLGAPRDATLKSVSAPLKIHQIQLICLLDSAVSFDFEALQEIQ